MQTWQKPALFVSQVPCGQSLLGSLLVSPWQMKFVSVTDRIVAASCSSFTYHHLHLFCVLCTATYKLNTSFFKMFNEHQWPRITLVWPTVSWVYIMKEGSIRVKNKFKFNIHLIHLWGLFWWFKAINGAKFPGWVVFEHVLWYNGYNPTQIKDGYHTKITLRI